MDIKDLNKKLSQLKEYFEDDYEDDSNEEVIGSFNVEILRDENDFIVYVGNEDGSGAEYKVQDSKEIGAKVQEYIDNYVI